MKYNQLTVTSNKARNRVGRGIAAGQGKTAGRGTKGQNARGSGTRPGFEGGQNPLMQRLPKLRGFRSTRPVVEVVYTSQLEQLSGGTIDNFMLAANGLVSNPHTKVKVIVKGDITKKRVVKLQFASQSAIAAIQKAGGTFTVAPQVKRPAKQKQE